MVEILLPIPVDAILYFVKLLVIILLISGVVGLITIIAINLRVVSYAAGRIYNTVEDVPTGYETAIVLGARVDGDGEPSNTLYDRTLTGVELYKAGKVPKLLLSGGGLEPEAMKAQALSMGVPADALIIDDLGLRTFESCRRARDVFAIDRAVIVTQDYHLPRSLYLCQNLRIDAVGVNAKRRDYRGERYAWVREYLSRMKAFKDINL